MIVSLVACTWLLAAVPAPAQAPAFAVTPDSSARQRAHIRVGPVLGEPQLGRALRSGLPVRLRVHVELWRDGFFDDLVGDASWTAVLLYEPIGEDYIVRTTASESVSRRYSSYKAARTAVEGGITLPLAPGRAGRYYYTATLEVETLSLSDLEELQHWLQGELRPAVGGEGSVTGALGEGFKRLLVRVLRLPTRRYDARSPEFEVR